MVVLHKKKSGGRQILSHIALLDGFPAKFFSNDDRVKDILSPVICLAHFVCGHTVSPFVLHPCNIAE